MNTLRQSISLIFLLFFSLLFSNAVVGKSPSAALINQAEQGNAKAQQELAIIYNETASTVEDYKKVFYWYENAARQGMAEAQLALGVMYCSGQGVEQDYIKAYAWYGLALNRGLEEAAPRQEVIVDFFLSTLEVEQAEKLMQQLEDTIKD